MTRREIIKKTALALSVLNLPIFLATKINASEMINYKNFEVIIIGGSYAGLSAAMALGRALRSVLVIDGGLPCNRQTPQSHNFITLDGEKPNIIAEKAKSQVLKYDTVKFHNAEVVACAKIDNDFLITTQNGEEFTAKKLVFATGVKDIMPNISGFAECWGISVVHCPYCHGYEIKREKTGIFANGNVAFHYAQLIRNWTTDLTIFTNGQSTLTQEQTTKIKKHNIPIIEKEIASFNHKNGYLENIVFKDTSTFALKAIYSRPIFEQHCLIPQELGCELTEQGYIKVDMFQRTTTANVFACGDNTSPMRSVANAVAAGNVTGAVLNNIITEEEFQ